MNKVNEVSLTLRFHWMHVRCVPPLEKVLLCYLTSSNPDWLHFESNMAQHCRTAGVGKLRSNNNNNIIMLDRRL